ncbi:uncharacterized protein LOC117535873 [Gymnodraco acuticeps]|uniref:Uncharacterized protein LOC117535873 n=1 Tax=Gymnodraco acuticeps TaxID=8218 RepID=A0A6P8SZ09_GYMAC|nr:uncharacterized protein LOC117535873 [Gymnodraco acuticeps]
MNAYLEEQDTIPLNIGITGECGPGKSTFVNAFRGLDKKDKTCLEKQGVESPKVFLVSYHLQLYDFRLLQETLERELPAHKIDTLLLASPIANLEIITKKKEALQSKIKFLAAASAFGAAVPFPGLSVAVDITMVTNAIYDKKRKKKNKIKESNAEEYKKEDVGSESGSNGGRGETGSDETSEPDGKRSYAGSKEKNEGTPVEEQSGNVKVEKGPDDGERVSRDVSAEAAKTALRHEKRQMDILRAMPDML